MEAKMCDAIEVHGRRYTIARILSQSYWESRDEWDIEFIDTNDDYHHWKQGFDGGFLIKKGDNMIPIPFKTNEVLEVVELFDKRYLFTNMRIDRDTLPEGAYAYDIRDNCDGEFCQVQNYVLVNHWGTIIGFDEIKEPMGIESDDWGFTGEALSWNEFATERKE